MNVIFLHLLLYTTQNSKLSEIEANVKAKKDRVKLDFTPTMITELLEREPGEQIRVQPTSYHY